ncbi:hypothetical protein CEV32_3812 [Brucella rhizosphaerae]|uniref:Uncharacterized protein n=1 Tax=Brucella rhizosphaerae TaxID=571254 RepID=A0A256FT40_9HYPH|nr:hypothetical protein CEV32_3812 [Brucella rhizosphaerae]
MKGGISRLFAFVNVWFKHAGQVQNNEMNGLHDLPNQVQVCNVEL